MFKASDGRKQPARILPILAICALVGSLQTMVSAQWLHYPTAGAPKRPDGGKNLTAPTPRMPNGKPDLSGIWTAADAIADPGCGADETGCIRQADLPLRAINMGLASREAFDRLSRGESAVDQLLPYRAWAADLVKRRAAYAVTGAGDLRNDDLVDPHV